MIEVGGARQQPAVLGAAGDDAAAIRESLRRAEAFTAIFDRHFDAVSSFVGRRVGTDAAEEIVSETFTRAFHGRSRFDPTYSSARPWLLGIASNILRRHWRSESNRLGAHPRMPRTPMDAGEPEGPVSAELRERLARLPAGQREVLLLHALAELTYEEIAAALGIRVGTVRSRLSRARSAMAATDRRGLPESSPTLNRPKEEGSNA